MCKFLKISRRVYYYNNTTNNKVDTDFENAVIHSFNDSKKRYGSRKISYDLKREGLYYSRYKVMKVMKKYNLESKYHLKKSKVSKSTNKERIENLVNREFYCNNEKKILTTDLSQVKIEKKTRYICFILNLQTRKIVASSVFNSKESYNVYTTLTNSSIDLETVDIFHSDRGTEFVNQDITKILEKYSIERSLSRPGTPIDNAPSESLFNTFKREFEFDNNDTFEMFKIKLRDYVNWYNSKRIHSTLNYITPNEMEKKLYS